MYNPQKMEALKRLQEEFKDISRRPMQNFGITVGLFDDDNLFEWKCTILGPKDTCYKGGLFYLKITFPDDYPNTKPEIVFLTPIYHLNVKFFAGGSQPLGHICVSTLNYWKKEYSINKVLPELFYLVGQNNPESPYDYSDNRRRNEYVNNRALFEEKARYFTKKYANPLGSKKEYTTDWDFTYNKK